jgi:hypothetical protein
MGGKEFKEYEEFEEYENAASSIGRRFRASSNP